MLTVELDYNLPAELIAQQALPGRASSRLMVLDWGGNEIEHRQFSDIVEYVRPGDCLVLNDSKVLPARFFVQRATGGRIEGLFLQTNDQGNWRVLLKNAGRLKLHESVRLIDPTERNDDEPVYLKVIERQPSGQWLLEAPYGRDHLQILERFGQTPLPPYIRREHQDADQEKADRTRYQTVYAQQPGSVAAPTAGLHFTEKLLEELKGKGVRIARVTLHVGLGTFQPVSVNKLEEHPMHAEYYQIDQTNTEIINQSKAGGGRIIAVGTTSVRTLESVSRSGKVEPGGDWTRLLIYPGYEFKIVDMLITNFHLPKTTLLALVCALAGKEKVLSAYREAIKLKYRFYSYGDAMLII